MIIYKPTSPKNGMKQAKVEEPIVDKLRRFA